MAKKIFSEVYESGAQRKVEEAIANKKFQKAAEILGNFPRPIKLEEKPAYLITIAEGYKALVSAMFEIGLPDEVVELRQRLGEYEAIEKPQAITEKLQRLKEYEELSRDADTLRRELKDLDEYRKISDTPEKLKERLNEAETEARSARGILSALERA
jgi:predicted metal-dependent hydrolase